MKYFVSAGIQSDASLPSRPLARLVVHRLGPEHGGNFVRPPHTEGVQTFFHRRRQSWFLPLLLALISNDLFLVYMDSDDEMI
jgi:hypothetical protein